jgi:hypothetical protein
MAQKPPAKNTSAKKAVSAKTAPAKKASGGATKSASSTKNTGQPQATQPSAGACVSSVSSTPGCLADCQTKSLTLSLKSLQGNVTIVNAEYPQGTAVSFTASSVTFTPKKGTNNLVVSYAFAPASSRAKLVENCAGQTLWDNNVNNSVNPAPYAVCA